MKGVLIDQMGHPTTLMIASFAAFGLGAMLVPAARSPVLMTFIGAVAGLPCGAMMVLPGEVLRPQNRAARMGVFYTWYYAGGMALLTPAAGILRDASGAPVLPYSLPARWSLRPRRFSPASTIPAPVQDGVLRPSNVCLCEMLANFDQ